MGETHHIVTGISDDATLGGINFTGGSQILPTLKAVKTYVDNIAQGLRIKDGVKVASTTEYNDVVY